jgi:hypothetical protein
MNRRIILFVLVLGLALVGCEGDTINQMPAAAIPAKMEISSGDHQMGVVGARSDAPLVVKVYLTDGKPAENVKVVFGVKSGDAVPETEVATSDANGVALTFVLFGETAEEIEITASADGLDGSPLTFHAISLAADAAYLHKVSGDQQTGSAGEELPESLVVKAADNYGNPAANQTVTFEVMYGGGSVATGEATTDDEGVASTTWTLGIEAGYQTVRVYSSGMRGYPLEFMAEAKAGPPAELTATGGSNQGGIVGQMLDEPLVVTVTDQYGNPVADVAVGFAVTAGDGTVDPASATTDSQGRASTALTLGSAGDHQVTATVESLTPVVFDAMAFTPVTLQPLAKDIDGIELAWDRNTNPGFVDYRVYRSTTTPVTEAATLLATITDETMTVYRDETVDIGVQYFYRVFVHSQGAFSFGSNEEAITAGLAASLSEIGFDLELDLVRDQIYVSLTNSNSVVTLDATTFEEISTTVVGTRPQGISLSSDGKHLYCALNTAGSIAAWNIDGGMVDQIIIGTELGDARTYDVLEVNPDEVLVTSNPGSNGFAYVVKVNIDFVGGHTAQRVASGRIIRASPTLQKSHDGTRAYVGAGFSPNSLYKLDMTNPAAPILLEDDHGSVGGTNRYVVSPDDALIFLRSGQVIQTSDFNQIGSIGGGVPALNKDGTLCYVGTNNAVQVWRTDTYLQVDSVPVPASVDRLTSVPSKGYLAVLSGGTLLGVPIP